MANDALLTRGFVIGCVRRDCGLVNQGGGELLDERQGTQAEAEGLQTEEIFTLGGSRLG